MQNLRKAQDADTSLFLEMDQSINTNTHNVVGDKLDVNTGAPAEVTYNCL